VIHPSRRLGALALAALMGALAPAAGAAPASILIGTGGRTGVYYPAGAAICRMVNRERERHGLRCTVASTAGSVYNIEALRGGAMTLAIVQSDWQYHAYRGSARFAGDGPFSELRAVLALHAEPFTVVARADSGIARLADLAGRRVNIGNPGSGQRGTMEVVMGALGWDRSVFALAAELAPDEQSRALCDDRIDAMVFTVGHPSGSIMEATTACDSRLVEVAGPAIDRLVAEQPYYRHAVIPGGMYRGNPDDVRTFGVGATLVTTAAVPEEVIYEVVRSVLENLERIRRLHPAFARLEARQMTREGLSAPLHRGALRYFREAGLQ